MGERHSEAEDTAGRELGDLRALVSSLEGDLAQAREAEQAARARADQADAELHRTRAQAEKWVADSRALMDETVAQARAEAKVARDECSEAQGRLRAMVEAGRDPRAPGDATPPGAGPDPIPAGAGEGCSVCRRPAGSLDAEGLLAAGWADAGEARVCPRCRAAGWQVAPGVDSPFRRYSDRRPRGLSHPG